MLNHLPISRLSGITFPAIADGHGAMQLALQYQLDSSQWWSPERLKAHQFEQLRALLIHSASTVPYYQRLFGQHGLQIPERIDAEFFRQIPISSRQAIQQAERDIESTALPSEHGGKEFGKTSGSTGRPVRFARTAVTRTFWLAFALRDHLWHGRDFTSKLGAIRWYSRGVAEAPAGAHEPNWGVIVAPLFATGQSCSLNVAATLAEQFDWLSRELPDYLVSFPSNLVALADYAQEQGSALPPVREIRTIGESLGDAQRQLIETAWQARVVDIYTCEEAGYLALQCPSSADYHVQTENVIVEIVDEQGAPCPPGKVGQVLITSLHNFATPLIRYEVGDMAEFGEPCACGRGLPVIRRIHGRKRNRLRLPSGDNLFPYLGEHGDITRVTGVKQYQFQCIQHSLEEIELKLVLERPLDTAEQAAVSALMQRNLGHPFRVRFSFPQDIPRGPSGKYEDFVSLIVG
jgi:phenylacetate-CoA ligase